MNIEGLFFSDYIYQALLLIAAVTAIPWIVLRRKFLLELQKCEPKIWQQLGSPAGLLLFAPLKGARVESFISRKQWRSLPDDLLIRMARKLYFIQRIELFIALVLVLTLFGPLLVNEFRGVG